VILGHGGDSDLGLAVVRSHRRPTPWPIRACGLAVVALLAACVAGSAALCAMLGYVQPLPH
jgi:hypothetical protein